MADPGLKYNPIVAYREITENGRVIKLQRVISETERLDYEIVLASQTDQPLGAAGAEGDYLSFLEITPLTTSPGAVSIKDGSGSAYIVFPGGASSVSNFLPFTWVAEAKSKNGAWKVTTGPNVTVFASGDFS